MEAIVVKGQVAGTVAMKLPEPPERWPALNGAGVEVYAERSRSPLGGRHLSEGRRLGLQTRSALKLSCELPR